MLILLLLNFIIEINAHVNYIIEINALLWEVKKVVKAVGRQSANSNLLCIVFMASTADHRRIQQLFLVFLILLNWKSR